MVYVFVTCLPCASTPKSGCEEWTTLLLPLPPQSQRATKKRQMKVKVCGAGRRRAGRTRRRPRSAFPRRACRASAPRLGRSGTTDSRGARANPQRRRRERTATPPIATPARCPRPRALVLLKREICIHAFECTCEHSRATGKLIKEKITAREHAAEQRMEQKKIHIIHIYLISPHRTSTIRTCEIDRERARGRIGSGEGRWRTREGKTKAYQV